MGPDVRASAEQARLNFGRSLAAHRERLGLSRADLVRMTRVPALLIGAIEEGEAEKWPERVFVVNALRSYSAAVGLPPEETLARFDGLPDAPRSEGFEPAELERRRRAQAAAGLLAVVAAGLALGLGSWLHTVWVFAHRAGWSRW